MAKKVKQIRYYSDDNTSNYGGPTYRNLISGSVFTPYIPMVQLGIQTLPGVKFYLNGSTNPVIVGSTGIYELDVQNLTDINSLQFDAGSVALIKNNDSAYLIVDIIYDKGSGL